MQTDGAVRVEIRDATAEDFPRILALNAASVHFLSPLDAARLAELHAEAAYHRVAAIDGRVRAFLLAFRQGCRYDSPNYRWFAAAYERFLYIDRIVVDDACRGHRIGKRLYADLFDFARAAQMPCVTCEFDTDPPNEASRRFHAGYGFREVGAQRVAGGRKAVSLQMVAL
jgi:predicted GNAT superfamily acetyltransferase